MESMKGDIIGYHGTGLALKDGRFKTVYTGTAYGHDRGDTKRSTIQECGNGKCTWRDSVRLPAARDSGCTRTLWPISESLQMLSMPGAASPEHYAEVGELVVMHGEEWPLRFTQADLSSLNTLARGDEDGEIVDWKSAA